MREKVFRVTTNTEHEHLGRINKQIIPLSTGDQDTRDAHTHLYNGSSP